MGVKQRTFSEQLSGPNRTLEQTEDYINGLKCEWLGVKTIDMSKDELIAFVGMLDDLATQRALNET